MHIPDDPNAYMKKFYFARRPWFRPISDQRPAEARRAGMCRDQWYPEAAHVLMRIAEPKPWLSHSHRLCLPQATRRTSSCASVKHGRRFSVVIANGLPVVSVNRVGFEPDPSRQTPGIQFWGFFYGGWPSGRELLYRSSDNEERERHS